MPHYTTKPQQVFAIQYTGDNAEEINKEFNIQTHAAGYSKDLYTTKYIRDLLPMCVTEPDMHIDVSDYIVRDHNGNISVMSAKEFEERYDNDLSQQ